MLLIGKGKKGKTIKRKILTKKKFDKKKVMLKHNEPNEQFSPSFKNNCSVSFIEC